MKPPQNISEQMLASKIHGLVTVIYTKRLGSIRPMLGELNQGSLSKINTVMLTKVIQNRLFVVDIIRFQQTFWRLNIMHQKHLILRVLPINDYMTKYLANLLQKMRFKTYMTNLNMILQKDTY